MSDVAVVERVYRALADKDIASLLELFAPDCVITQDERLPWGGRFAGHDGLIAFAIDTSAMLEALGNATGSAPADL